MSLSCDTYCVSCDSYVLFNRNCITPHAHLIARILLGTKGATTHICHFVHCVYTYHMICFVRHIFRIIVLCDVYLCITYCVLRSGAEVESLYFYYLPLWAFTAWEAPLVTHLHPFAPNIQPSHLYPVFNPSFYVHHQGFSGGILNDLEHYSSSADTIP